MGQLAGAITQGVGAVIGAVGGLQGGYYDAAVARNNAKIAQYNATLKLQEGQRAEMAQRLKTDTLIGSEKAGYASGNIDVSTGSAVDVFGNTAMLGELDALTLRYNAEGAAQGLRQQARAFNSQANQSITAAWFNAGSSLLGGASSIADKWNNFPTDAGSTISASGTASESSGLDYQSIFAAAAGG